MKNILKKSVFALMFVFAFLVAGTMVKADEIQHRPTVSGYQGAYDVDENTYYAVRKDENGEVNFTVKAKELTQNTYLGQQRYQALVSVVKCEALDAEACANWKGYNYSADKNQTMDALIAGLKINFDTTAYQDMEGTVNGVNLSALTSVHGTDKTYFVLVQYSFQKLWISGSQTTVYRVVVADDLEQLSITTSVVSGKLQVTVKSGTPISHVTYLKSETALSEVTDEAYEAAYETSETAGVLQEAALTNPEMVDGKFVSVFEIENYETGKYYYIKAQDKAGSVAIKDVYNDTVTPVDPEKPVSDDTGNVNTKLVGQIILISLIVIFVIALVLVIVQKIVDYRKRLY